MLATGARELAPAVAVATATVVWRTGANPIAATFGGLLAAAVAVAVHRLLRRR